MHCAMRIGSQLVTECRRFWRRAFRVTENDGSGPKRERGVGRAGYCEVNEFPEGGIGSIFTEYLDEEITKSNIRFQPMTVDLRIEIGAWRRQRKKHHFRHSHPLGEACVRSSKRS